MLKEENGDTSNNLARMCDTCQSAPWTVYCRADAAYLCTGCDSRIHAANGSASRHERVWVCEACESAPAAFLCKADAASLCTTCDADIHSANPLVRCHKRVPILPIPGSLYGPSAAPTGDMDADDEAASWLLLNRVKNSENEENNNGHLSGEADEYLDLNQYNSSQEIHFTDKKLYGGDSVVPVQYGSKGKEEVDLNSFQLEIEFDVSNDGYSYPAMDIGVVPESRLSGVSSSVSQQRPSKDTVDLFSNPPIHMPTQLSGMDREARVLRYREKKKMRKFEKTIRYASRKAYAETRPRIKGRFAKRTDIDQMFCTSLIAGTTRYGIVPSF